MKLYGFANRKLLTICKKHFYLCLVVVSVICFVTYTEIISYIISTRRWLRLQCLEPTKCLKVLLVADPQIIGHEKMKFLTSIAQYDSDRYLKKTYQHAVDFVKPDVTIFLGDLMDEGSIALIDEYEGYLKRFFYIFPKEKSRKQIWLPGDNDIGGEGADRIEYHKLQRFHKSFGHDDILKYDKITFMKVNVMTKSIPNLERQRDFYNTKEIFIILSHMPLLFMPTAFVEKVLTNVQPHIIFAAHQHQSMIISSDALLRNDRKIVPVEPHDNKIYKFDIGSSDMYEILVPTCSYRMGAYKIGYGFAVIENDELQYTVLWTPSRFHQLWNYGLFFVIIVIVSIIVKFCK